MADPQTCFGMGFLFKFQNGPIYLNEIPNTQPLNPQNHIFDIKVALLVSLQVKLLGQGSGATSILALLASPKAIGLFHGAWLMSPSPKLNTTIAEAIEKNQFFVDKTNKSSKAGLCSLEYVSK